MEEKYWLAEALSVNFHWDPTFSIFQFYFVRNILIFQNDTKVPATMKLQTSDNYSKVKIIPEGLKISENIEN